MNQSTVLAIIFFVTAVVLAFKLAKKKRPAWAYRTTRIIGLGSGAPPELTLSFNGQPINNAYRTRFIFFNRGNETVRSDDVTQSIVIHFQGAKILRSPIVLAQSKQAIGASVKQIVEDDEDAVRLNFSYLDHNDGMVVEVLHTESQNMKCSGNIIGASEIRYVGELLPPPREMLKVGIPMLAVSSALLVYAIVELTLGLWKEAGKLGLAICIAFIVIAAPMIGIHLSFVWRGMKFPKWSRLKE